MRVIQLLFCPLFLYFASLQLNDPDAVVWVTVYGMAAINCGVAAAGKPRLLPATMLCVGAIGWATVLSLGISDTLVQSQDVTSSPLALTENEVIREVGGLAIVTLWSGVTAISAMRRRWKQDE